MEENKGVIREKKSERAIIKRSGCQVMERGMK